MGDQGEAALPSSEEIAWAAGLFEGEGWISHKSNGQGGTNRQLGISMTDRDVVERFQEVVACGKITEREMSSGRKNQWTWRCGKWEDVERLLRLFLPYFGARRKEKTEMLLADPPMGGRHKERCGKCGGLLRFAPGDSGAQLSESVG